MADFKYIKEDDKGTVTVAPQTTTPPTPPLPVTLNVEGTVNVTENLTVKGKINEGQKWYEVLPKGVIMMWYGKDKTPDGKDKIPDGWAICDGTGDTPDLRGRFVMGADVNSVANKMTYDTCKKRIAEAINNYNNDIDTRNKQIETGTTKKKRWEELTEKEKKSENSNLSNAIIAAETDLDSHPNLERAIHSKGETGGVHPMKKEPHVSGSGLDMSKAGYISEIDYPPYMALYYIIKV